MNAVGHPALLIVDAVSSLGVHRLSPRRVGGRRHRRRLAEGPDAAAGPRFQRRVGEGAGRQPERRKLRRSYWDWQEMLTQNRTGFFPYTPATNLLFALREALRMLQEEGLHERIPPARSTRGSDARRRAAWGFEHRLRGSARVLELDDGLLHARGPRRRSLPRRSCSSISTCRSAIGLSKLAGKVVRIGHLGSFNDLMLAGHAERHRNGPSAGGRAPPGGRRDGGASKPRRRKFPPYSRLHSARSAAAQLARQTDRFVSPGRRSRAGAETRRSRRGALRSRQPRAVRDRRLELPPDSDRPRRSPRCRRCDRGGGRVPAVSTRRCCRAAPAPASPASAATSRWCSTSRST